MFTGIAHTDVHTRQNSKQLEELRPGPSINCLPPTEGCHSLCRDRNPSHDLQTTKHHETLFKSFQSLPTTNNTREFRLVNVKTAWNSTASPFIVSSMHGIMDLFRATISHFLFIYTHLNPVPRFSFLLSCSFPSSGFFLSFFMHRLRYAFSPAMTLPTIEV
ncbi:hypothetical protein B0T13DRAFT_464306 [Neurospora crassa]|nr:hypothetical protein B0T13DRAFT_464306 [Neurospora crassa]